MTKTTYVRLNLTKEKPYERDYIRIYSAYNALAATLNLIKTGVIK